MQCNTGVVDAPITTVAAAARHTPTAEDGLTSLRVRGRASGAGALLVPGDEITFRLGGRLGRLTTRIVRADVEAVSSVIVAGPCPVLRHEKTFTDLGGRTRVTDTLHWTSPLATLGRVADAVALRRFARAVLRRRFDAITELATAWAARDVVVGTAIVRDGLLLGQQRHYPASDAGRWELPGGRVEPGESEHDAVIRECAEELGVRVRPTGRVGTDVPLDGMSPGMVLRVHEAELVDADAVPRAVEHRDVRWIGPAGVAAVDWLEADRLLAASMRALLR